MRSFAIISPNYSPVTCGVGDNSARLAMELVSRGFSATVITRTPASRNPEALNVPVIAVAGRSPMAIARGVIDAVPDPGACNVIIQYTPQMFGVSRFGSSALPYVTRALRSRGATVTVIAHELFLPWSVRPDLLLGASLLRLQFLALASAADQMGVTTETRMRMAEPYFACARVRRPPFVFRVGSNASPVCHALSATGFRIGTFSTLAVGKRIDVLMDAFSIVAHRVPEAELWLLGDLWGRHDASTRRFRNSVSDHPFSSRIHIPGKQPLAMVASAVASLNVFAFPGDTGANTRSSTLPLAFGAGIPVVATCGSETDGLFEDGRNVLFALDLSPTSIADSLLRLHGDRQMARRIGEGGRALYLAELDWNQIVDSLLANLARH